jgi:multiple sugar transport system permease protein
MASVSRSAADFVRAAYLLPLRGTRRSPSSARCSIQFGIVNGIEGPRRDEPFPSFFCGSLNVESLRAGDSVPTALLTTIARRLALLPSRLVLMARLAPGVGPEEVVTEARLAIIPVHRGAATDDHRLARRAAYHRTFNEFDDIFPLTGGAAGTVASVQIYNYLTVQRNVGAQPHSR